MEKYDVKFKKKFGQNFLKDVSVVKRIVDSANIEGESLVIEVGPGGAIMTRELSKVATNVLAYEIDSDLEDELASRLYDCNNVRVLFQDFLSSNLCNDIDNYSYENLYFVSNVPYYITTPIILKLISSKLHFKKIVVMVQKEVGVRFTTGPGSKDYGSISVLLQYYFHVKKEFYVSRGMFVPVPNVDSVVISFEERTDREEVCDLEFFETIVRNSFQFKRKTIKNNLKKYDLSIVEEVLIKHGFNLNTRAEDLEVVVFVDLANALYRK